MKDLPAHFLAVSHLLPEKVQSSRAETLDEQIGKGELQFRLQVSDYPNGLLFHGPGEIREFGLSRNQGRQKCE